MANTHVFITNNCSGFKPKIIEQFINTDYAFIFLQETHHFESSQSIYDNTNRFKTFHISGMDEAIANPVKRGGIITYINNKITNDTSVYTANPQYLVTITGKLVCINVYLPQQGLFENGVYDQSVSEIIGIIEDLGDSYAYIVVGDFNSNGPNIGPFHHLIEIMDLEDWSGNIPYTYSQNTRGGLCATKLDHVLTKNFPEQMLNSCDIDQSLVTTGGHLIIKTIASIPHLEIDNLDESYDNDSDIIQPICIDFDKINDSQVEFFRQEASTILRTLRESQLRNIKCNPLGTILSAFNKLGSTAKVIFPQKPSISDKMKPKPGWNKYVKEAQANYTEARCAWETMLFPSQGYFADEVRNSKKLRDDCLKEMEKNTERSVAEALTEDLTAPTANDRSRCWKPVRSCVKGNTNVITPILNGLKKDQSIVDYWAKFYKKKMRGSNAPEENDTSEYTKLSNKKADKIKITPTIVLKSINELNSKCSYYDEYTPRLLELINVIFAEFFSEFINKFLNASSLEQKYFLTEENNLFISYIRPIIKSSNLNATIPKSYRPISVSHTLTVLLERVLANSYFSIEYPKNFFGYVPKRSCDIAVMTLKDIVKTVTKDNVTIALLDASGAFESVVWDKIFPRLAKRINPKVIVSVWNLYRFNRYETRWSKSRSNEHFYASQGTKQGGVLSGMIFLEYMKILADDLKLVAGVKFNKSSWNSLFYADDVLLIGLNTTHLQRMLNLCEDFERNGFVQWNASKSVILKLTSKRSFIPPKYSIFQLNNAALMHKSNHRYLGYMLNQKMNDETTIERQSRRLYALANNISSALPLNLLGDNRLKSLASAYGGIYMLPVFTSYTKKIFSKLSTAHRYFVAKITQFYNRDPDHWDPDNNVYEAKNRHIYGRLRIKTFDTMCSNQRINFMNRYDSFLAIVAN